MSDRDRPDPEGPSEGGVFTRSQVQSWFKQAGEKVTIRDDDGTVIESATQRLDRLVFQLNSGQRSEKQVLKEIYEGTGGTLERGAQGASLLTEIYGGSPELWYDRTKDEWFLAYGVPGTDVPLLYSISRAELRAIFPDSKPIADRKVTSREIRRMGGIHAGTAEDPYGDPYADFIDMMEKESQIKPWLRDPDMVAVLFEAILEGREPTEAELSQTDWWQNHNETEREWLMLSFGDPRTAEQMIADSRIAVRDQLEQLGVANPADDLVNFMADKWISGAWSDTYFLDQARGVADPFSGNDLDRGLKRVLRRLDEPVDTTQQHEERVRGEVLRWLGPVYGQWSEKQIARWAGRLRNDPDAMDALTGMLRSQRMALFPEYANENLTYEDIAAPWRNMVSSVWGQEADETDPFFDQIVRSNDYAEAGKALRREGLTRDISTVQQDIERAANQTNSRYRPIA